MIELPKSEGLNTVAFSMMFTSMTNSYKLLWFKAIFDHVLEGKTEIAVDKLVQSMVIEAFPFIHKYKLGFSVQDQIESTLRTIPNAYRGNGDFTSLSTVINQKQLKKLHKEITNYVPYRLLTPFYKNVKSKNDATRNKDISRAMLSDANSFYYFNKSNNTVLVSEKWIQYILTNQNLILGWYKYHLIKFLQKRNPSTPNIPAKIDAVRENINDQRAFWKRIAQFEPRIDFDIYQNISFSTHSQEQLGSFSLDHILPFDFVSHDLIWNLVPTHKNINSQKGTKLPSLQLIERAVDTQYLFFKTARKVDKLSKKEIGMLQEYKYLNQKLDYLDESINEETFKYILKEQLQSLYSIAYNQGFEHWRSD